MNNFSKLIKHAEQSQKQKEEEVEKAREQLQRSVKSKLRENRQRFEKSGRQNDQDMHSSGSTIQRPRMGKQYESFNDKGGLDEPDYEAVARGIEQIKRDRQERVASHYRAAQEEHERRRAELKLINERLSKLETENQELKSLLKGCLNELE